MKESFTSPGVTKESFRTSGQRRVEARTTSSGVKTT
jgi:hypothetical protein